MKIGVIGVGEIGGPLATKWSVNGHDVSIANSRGPEAVRALAAKIGATPGDVFTAVEDAEVVLLSMPFPAVSRLPKHLLGRASGDVVIIDTANYYPELRDPRIAEIDAGMPESVWVSEQLGRPIFKAFNSIMFYSLSEKGKPRGSPDRLAVPVAGDDPAHKQTVMQLVDEAGFDPVDGGALAESWRQQPSTPAYCCDYGADMTLPGIAAATKGQAETIRDTAWRANYLKLFEDKPDYADVHDAVIALNRSLNTLNAGVLSGTT
jgi:predicted dinucleotide-binding enzyme